MSARCSSYLAALLPVAATFAACAVEEPLRPRDDGPETARAMGFFARERSSDPLVEARRAYERDALFREARFINAVSPGHLYASTRIDEAALASGSVGVDVLWQVGAQLFHHELTLAEGLGGADLPFPRRFHAGFRGGPDATSCASCHWRGGIAGAGDGADQAYLQGDGDSASSALARDPIALVGAGYVELAAREMSAELDAQRVALTAHAKATGRVARAPLTAKGVPFGVLAVAPDGSVDASELAGVDADLVVRPFGHKGSFSTLRDVVEDALLVHHGLQTSHLVASLPRLEAKLGPYAGDDPDGDGVVDEVTEAQLSALTAFIAMTEVPIEDVPNSPLVSVSMLAEGRTRFESIGCASCHVPVTELVSTRWELPSRSGGAPLIVDLERDGADPKLRPRATDGRSSLALYSDLKRHDMGASLAERRSDRGVPSTMFITRPLWGLASSAPYLHDGRAPTIHEAIILHDGEAREARDAYVALGEAGQAPLRVFLQSLTRAPTYTVR